MFSQQEIQEIQDSLQTFAIRKSEREERRVMDHTKIVLFRCTMCGNLKRELIEDDNDCFSDIDLLIKAKFTEVSTHSCDESAGIHRKYGVYLPVGVLSKW